MQTTTQNYIPFHTYKAFETMINNTLDCINKALVQAEEERKNLPKENTEIAMKHFHAIVEKIKYFRGYKAACNAFMSYLDNSTTYHQ